MNWKIVFLLLLLIGCSAENNEIIPVVTTITTSVETTIVETVETTVEVVEDDYEIMQIVYDGFEPRSMFVNKDTNVVFLQNDTKKSIHHIILKSKMFGEDSIRLDSGKLFYGMTFNYTFSKKGEFEVLDISYDKRKWPEGIEGAVIVE